MTRRLFDPETIAKRFEPDGFSLNLPECHQHGISLIRPSFIGRLYEHVLIRAGNPVYADIAISAASFTSCHSCVSERDDSLRSFLAEDSQFQASLIKKPGEAKAWITRLVENAVPYCVAAAASRGPQLIRGLHPVFEAVNAYAGCFGDMFEILDREFTFSANHYPKSDNKQNNLRVWHAACFTWISTIRSLPA